MSHTDNTRRSTAATVWANVRRWAYGVAIAFVPVAVYFKWIEPEAAPIILPLILALIMVKTPDQTPPSGRGGGDAM